MRKENYTIKIYLDEKLWDYVLLESSKHNITPSKVIRNLISNQLKIKGEK